MAMITKDNTKTWKKRGCRVLYLLKIQTLYGIHVTHCMVYPQAGCQFYAHQALRSSAAGVLQDGSVG